MHCSAARASMPGCPPVARPHPYESQLGHSECGPGIPDDVRAGGGRLLNDIYRAVCFVVCESACRCEIRQAPDSSRNTMTALSSCVT